MKCQTKNVTANVQSDHLLHGYMLPVFFATDQLHRQPRSAAHRNKTLPQLVRIADWYSIRVKNERKMKKMKKLCILQGSTVTFSGVVGKG